MPAIPVISNHDGDIRPIQDYSFTLRSISDRNISILRVYAEEGMAAEIQKECNEWYTVDYSNKINQLTAEKRKREELDGAVKESDRKIAELMQALNTQTDKEVLGQSQSHK